MSKPDGFTVDYTLKDFFFDRLAVQSRIDKVEQRKLSEIGAFIRQRAIRSLRRRKRASMPGQQPSVRSRDKVTNIRNILFGYDDRNSSVIVGPVRLNGLGHGVRSAPVPSLLEFGGQTTIIESRYSDRKMLWHPGIWKQGPVETRRKRVTIKPRPYMRPALEAERAAGTLKDVWIDCLEKAA